MEFYIAGVHEGVVRYAKEAGWILDASMMHRREVPAGWQGDGVLAEILSPGMEEMIRLLGRPVVAMLVQPPNTPCPCVLMDNHMIGRWAAEHLMGRGFTRLAYYQHTGSRVLDERGEGFRQTVQAAGHEFHHLHAGKMAAARRKTQDRIGWLADKLRKLPMPLGVFADSDEWAIEVMNACRIDGLAVPDQVAIIGVDNNPLYVDVAPVPLSSVDNDLARLGYEAAAMLDRILNGQPAPARPMVIPPVGIVTRRSTDILAVENVTVAKSLAFMYQHFRHPIRVEDVAAHCAVSLRRLQELFKQAFGSTMIQELTRLRLDHALKLLRETGEKVDPIARRSGFASGKYLNKVMTARIGSGPGAYRREHRRG